MFPLFAVELNRVDPTYHATQLHFEDLFKRYGSPLLVLDLVKQSEKREREVRVGNEYRHAIDYINSTISDPRHRVRMCALDYSHTSKHRQLDVSSSLGEVSTWAVNSTGFFCSYPKWKITKEGVVEPFTEEDTTASKELSRKLGVPVFPMEQSGVLRTSKYPDRNDLWLHLPHELNRTFVHHQIALSKHLLVSVACQFPPRTTHRYI